MISDKKGVYRILFCGACLSGNMGGQALYFSIINGLKKSSLGNVQVTVLSKYPIDDRPVCERMNWQMIPFGTVSQIVYGLPFFIIGSLLRKIRLPWRWLACGPIKAYLKHDILVDLSGISFSDNRSFTGLVINCLWLMPAVVSGIPYVKVSQSMGPFNKSINKLLSRFFLSRASMIIARGKRSAEFLTRLLPFKNIQALPDVAFSLDSVPQEEINNIISKLGLKVDDSFAVVGPNYVVDDLIRNKGKSYSEIMAKAIDKLNELLKCKILLVPYERAHTGSLKDDVYICHSIYEKVIEKDRLTVVEDLLDAQQLQGLVSKATVAIGSRFHFMVAAMATGVPSLCISWSHKYEEMMRMFSQEQYVIPFYDITEENVVEKVTELVVNLNKEKEVLLDCLPGIRKLAERHADIIAEIVLANKIKRR